MEQYLEEIAALDTKYSVICKPLCKERGNVVARGLYDDIKRIHKEGGGEKEEEGSKIYVDGGNDNTEEGEEREGSAFLEDASNDDDIYGAVSSKGTTITNDKAAKGDNDKERRMLLILQLWVCAIKHMEAVAKLITEKDINCLENLTEVTCRDF